MPTLRPRPPLVEEIPFDVAVWGDIEIPPAVIEETRKHLETIKYSPEPEWFWKLRQRADQRREEDLALELWFFGDGPAPWQKPPA